MNAKQRIAIALLTISAGAVVKIQVDEGYTDRAIIPVKGDRPTIGHGSTTRLDGSPVRMGDTTTPELAKQRTMAYLDNQSAQIKRCIRAPLHHVEFDVVNDFAYQYGIGALCKSSIASKVNAGDYAGACRAYLQYRFTAGYDCSTLVNGKPNKRCYGVWTRQQERYQKCMGVQ